MVASPSRNVSPTISSTIGRRARMRVRCVLTAIAMLFLSLPASAQTRTLTGTVTDASTGQPLEGARITVRGTSLATTTGAAGQFTLGGLPNGGITVSIRRIGNNPVEIVLAPSQNSISVTLTRTLRPVGFGDRQATRSSSQPRHAVAGDGEEWRACRNRRSNRRCRGRLLAHRSRPTLVPLAAGCRCVCAG